MLKTLAILTAVLMFAVSTHANVIVHDNTDATFVWRARGTEGRIGSFFDPTLAPSAQESATFTPRSLQHNASLGGPSTFIGRDGIGGGTAINLALQSDSITIDPPGDIGPSTFLPALVFDSGSEVTSLSPFGNYADTGYFNASLGRNNFLGQHPFIGFRVRLDDNALHYGWIELDYRLGQTAGGVTLMFYQPVRWAYETLPNTPITVPSAPAAVLLAAAGAATLRRSRRGT